MRFLLSCSLIIILQTNLWSQKLSENIQFFNYLINTRNYSEASLLLNTLNDHTEDSQDSINFYKGKVFYLDQDLSEATIHFSKINIAHPFYRQSLYYNAFCKSHIGEYQSALDDLKQISPADSLHFSLKTLEQSGIYLLNRDLSSFDQLSQDFNGRYYQTSTQEQSLLNIRNDLRARKNKSPLIAGVLSAAIPGMGRIYAGKTGLGIGTLLTSAVFALQTWEGYKKDGVKSARFIIFGSIFSIFYVGNIWGSAFTVKISNAEFNEAVNHKILVDMHIPLRSIFN